MNDLRWVHDASQENLKERFLHAFLFEILAIGLCAPVAAWAMGKSLFEMGVLTAVIAWIALVWNMIYNAGFDRLENRYGLTRNPAARHSCLRLRAGPDPDRDSAGRVVVEHQPVAGFRADIALVLFYLPYAFFYNLAYDKSRSRVIRWLNAVAAAPARQPRSPPINRSNQVSRRRIRVRALLAVCAVVLRL